MGKRHYKRAVLDEADHIEEIIRQNSRHMSFEDEKALRLSNPCLADEWEKKCRERDREYGIVRRYYI